MKFGLIGTAIDNGNLGCVALTYSLVNILNEIDRDNELIIFDSRINEKKLLAMCDKLHISSDRIKLKKLASKSSKNTLKKISFAHNVKKCDLVINLTEGDSFSDIYGDNRFNWWADIMLFCEKQKIPLILGPQTYGPYKKKSNETKAKMIIEQALTVISRDELSKDYIETFSRKSPVVVTDLAFSLPYTIPMLKPTKKRRVGLNVSGLLWNDNFESSTTKNFDMKLNYPTLINQLIDQLLSRDFDVFLVPHVIGADDIANEEIKKNYSNITVCEPFETPIDAKNFISSLDFFIGSRMHATIAAFSSGVVTIPLSYSRKFKGLFNALDYNHDIDITTASQNQVISAIFEMIDNERQLKEQIKKGNIKAQKKIHLLKNVLNQEIHNLRSDS